MDVCFIGNSHLAALKGGLDIAPDALGDAKATMFGARGGSLKGLTVDGTQLCSGDLGTRESWERSGGASSIDLAGVDAVVTVGLGLGPTVHMSLAAEIASGKYLSPSLCDAMIADAYNGGVAQIGAAVRAIAPDVPMALVPDPLPAEGELERDSTQGRIFAKAAEFDVNSEPISDFEKAAALWAAETLDATFIPQAPATRDGGILTDVSFSRGGLNWNSLGNDREVRDHRHMNSDYGVVMLAEVAAWLDQIPR